MTMLDINKFLEQIKNEGKPKPPMFTPNEFKTMWIAIGNKLTPNYEPDEVALLMCKHLYAHNKGIVFYGNMGVGKSLNMDIYTHFLRYWTKKSVENWEVNDIEITYRNSDKSFFKQLAQCDVLVLNEVGIESAVLKDFGTDRNLIADLLYLRYRLFQTSGKKTYVTCNMKPDTMCNRYGDRLADRFKEMFDFVELKGKSKR